MGRDIYVVTGPGHGHLHPCMELCNHLNKRNYHTTLVLSSTLSSAIPSSFTQNLLTTIAQIAPSPRPLPGSDPLSHQAAEDLRAHLANRCEVPDLPLPICAIIDFQLGWTKEVFRKFNIPVIGLFTFGASAAAMEWAAWKVQAGDVKPGETRLVPGLPEEMAITYWDRKRKPFGPQRGLGPRPGGEGPPKPGDKPPWVPEIEGSVALMFNTCDDLDGPFIKYMEDQLGMPTWGVGPLLPEKYWQPSDSLISDPVIRGQRRESNLSDDEVIQWLDSKPHGSVLYVAFGSEVGPTTEECEQLAHALEDWTRPFIWVIRADKEYRPDPCLDKRVGNRGLIICGWAPQLMILSHKSTGGFLSHCGWNSTMEAIGRGVPVLAWPIRGDQYYNANLVVNYLKVGHRVADDLSEMAEKDDIVKGIERLMSDEETRDRMAGMKSVFDHGFPACSVLALDAFTDFIYQNST